MKARLVIGIAALVCVPVLGFIAIFKLFEVIDKVNERLPKEEQFEWLGWYAGKYFRLSREYNRLYPDGHLLSQVHLISALMYVVSIICAWCFRFFVK